MMRCENCIKKMEICGKHIIYVDNTIHITIVMQNYCQFSNCIFCWFVTVMNVSFGAPRFSVVEGKGFAELVLTKTPGAVGPVSVNLFTVDGSAG